MAHQKQTKRMVLFLKALECSANVSEACEQSGLDRRTAYRVREDDPEFKEAWDKASELGTEALEDEAIRRAHRGIDEPVFYKGEICGAVRKYSDTLMIFMLKARKPEKYRERRDGGTDEEPFTITIKGGLPE